MIFESLNNGMSPNKLHGTYHRNFC